MTCLLLRYRLTKTPGKKTFRHSGRYHIPHKKGGLTGSPFFICFHLLLPLEYDLNGKRPYVAHHDRRSQRLAASRADARFTEGGVVWIGLKFVFLLPKFSSS
jgi:hypothetical protein